MMTGRWIALCAALVAVVACCSGCLESRTNCDFSLGSALAAEPAATPKPEPSAKSAAKGTVKREDLAGRRFELVNVNGEEFAAKFGEFDVRRPDIEFDKDFNISGQVCNNFSGAAQLKDGKLTAANMAVTTKMCFAPQLTDLEPKFFAMLRAGADIELAEDGRLLLLAQGGTVLIYALAAVAETVIEEAGEPESAAEGAVKAEDLAGLRFELVSVDGKKFAVEGFEQPTIEFNEGERQENEMGLLLFGKVCNNFRGPAQLQDGKLVATHLAATMMMCGDELMKLELRLVSMLNGGADVAFSKKDGRLTLSEGGTVLVYARLLEPEPEGTVKAEDLLHRRFALAGVNGEEFTVEDRDQRPTIEFNEGFQIAGRVCNPFRGPAQLKDGKLVAENLVTGRMMCAGRLGELENLFLAMLRAGADVSLSEDGGLTLTEGGTVLVYTRADWVR